LTFSLLDMKAQITIRFVGVPTPEILHTPKFGQDWDDFYQDLAFRYSSSGFEIVACIEEGVHDEQWLVRDTLQTDAIELS
jgi:hypothetical protein